MKKLKPSEFIEKSKLIHNSKYDYSKVEYKNNCTKVCIICPEHGEFWQKPNHHMRGIGCPKCGGTGKLSKKEFEEKSNIIHNYKYDYSKVEYKNNCTKVCIICPEHGEFWQKPNHHMRGSGCCKCSFKKLSSLYEMTIKEFTERSNIIHNFKYDYSKFEYINSNTKGCIICPEHGKFWQKPSKHLNGNGCFKCSFTIYNTKSFVEKSSELHNNKYNYLQFEYINSKTKGCIICPEHGKFWQTPSDHTQGCGCPHCKKSNIEEHTESYLKKNNIEFVYRYRGFSWLKNKKTNYPLELDFYLPEYNIAIECQGIQHFKPIEYFGGEKTHKKMIERDLLKKQLCKQHNLPLHYINHNEIIEQKLFNILFIYK